MSTEKVETEKGDVLVVEVTPSFDTPVRYRGRTFIRIGPRRDIASVEEERILAERCAASLPTFDTRPCREAKLEDFDVDAIVKEYLPKFIMPGAYIQFVHFKGETNGGAILVSISILREKDVLNYPFKALRELMMNAVMHRDYQSNMPTRFYQYDNLH